MKRLKKLNLDDLKHRLILLSEIEKHNMLGGQSSTSTIDDIWDRIKNGNFDDVPAGRYDFNTNQFTPYDPSMQDADWYIAIKEVYVTAAYNSYSNDYSNYNGSYNPYIDIPYNPNDNHNNNLSSYDYFNTLINGTTPFSGDYYYPGYNGEGGDPGSPIVGPGGGGGSTAPGVFYITGRSDALSIVNLKLPYRGYSTEKEFLDVMAEHYSTQSNSYDFYKYVYSSDSLLKLIGMDNDPEIKIFLDPDRPSEINNYDLAFKYITDIIDRLLTAVEFAVAAEVVPDILVRLLGDDRGEWIGKVGDLTGFLDSDFEKNLFKNFWEGSIVNGNMIIAESDYGELRTYQPSIDISKESYDSNKFSSNDGNSYYFVPISTYGGEYESKYKGGLGQFYGIYDSSGEMVGMYDYYNFDNSNRSFGSESVTRLINSVAPYTATPYDISYGDIPEDLYDYLKSESRN